MFCERCGTRYGSEETARMGVPFARRLLEAVGVVEAAAKPAADPFLRFCLACRGYSCPSCWNEDAGFCQTCVPSAEVEGPPLALPEALTIARQPEMVGHEHRPVIPVPATLAFEPPIRSPEPDFGFAPVFALPPGAIPSPIVAAPEPTIEPAPVMVAARQPEPDMLAEPAPAPEAEPEIVVAPEAEPESVAALAPEPELEIVGATPAEAEPEMAAAAPQPEQEMVAVAQSEPEPEPELVAATESEPEMVAAPEPEPEVAVAAPAEPEPEIGASTTFEETSFTEPEPDIHWDWVLTLDANSEELPFAAAHDGSAAAIVSPAVLETPPPLPPVVFRPLELTGQFLPPPPPPAPAQTPRIEFDLPTAPPAFLIARQPDLIATRPVLPLGMFDGPAPQIRPCPTCQLPVSARARFCRRCGSAQD